MSLHWVYDEPGCQWEAECGCWTSTVYRRNVHGFNWHVGSWRPAYGYFRFAEGSQRSMPKAKLAAEAWIKKHIKAMQKDLKRGRP